MEDSVLTQLIHTDESRFVTNSVNDRIARIWITALGMMLLLTGCLGKSVDEDNPVFAPAPPRRSLVNQSADVNEQKYVSRGQDGGVKNVGFSSSDPAVLTGNSIVAEINGKPVFVDDVIPGIRDKIEADGRMRDQQKQAIIRQYVQKRLPEHINQEVVLQALNAKVPEDRRESIREALEPSFQKVLENIRKDKNIQSDEQLDEELGKEGLTVAQLKETFIRIQMVNGYVAAEASTSDLVDREEMVQFYQDHIADYSHRQRIRCREIIVRFSAHGGRKGAEQVMANAVTQLQQNTDFGKGAESFSDASTSSKQGDLGWIEEGYLADKEVEAALLALPKGDMTRVFVREDRFEVYQVSDIQKSHVVPFQEVQKDIEKQILQQRADEARKKVVSDLREKAVVVTMFDE
jgi:parvulin-like peptidyl-prolyl isomerase